MRIVLLERTDHVCLTCCETFAHDVVCQQYCLQTNCTPSNTAYVAHTVCISHHARQLTQSIGYSLYYFGSHGPYLCPMSGYCNLQCDYIHHYSILADHTIISPVQVTHPLVAEGRLVLRVLG